MAQEAAALGIPVLTETPPAADTEGLRRLWGEVGGSGLVQVAEQYPRYPSHSARANLVRSGAIGVAGDFGHQRADERAVDLDRVQGELVQVTQRRIAGAEVVQRQAHAGGVEFGHHAADLVGILQQGALGDLDAQPLRRQAGAFQQAQQAAGEVAALQVATGREPGDAMEGR